METIQLGESNIYNKIQYLSKNNRVKHIAIKYDGILSNNLLDTIIHPRRQINSCIIDIKLNNKIMEQIEKNHIIHLLTHYNVHDIDTLNRLLSILSINIDKPYYKRIIIYMNDINLDKNKIVVFEHHGFLIKACNNISISRFINNEPISIYIDNSLSNLQSIYNNIQSEGTCIPSLYLIDYNTETNNIYNIQNIDKLNANYNKEYYKIIKSKIIDKKINSFMIKQIKEKNVICI